MRKHSIIFGGKIKTMQDNLYNGTILLKFCIGMITGLSKKFRVLLMIFSCREQENLVGDFSGDTLSSSGMIPMMREVSP